ncbi:MAG TPA: winged helix-turn-helix transcriptional regulator [Candidatus Thermoplasmatota archaeon]|jgi:predicted transcriptional regulator|nr:winged helix-turn-helix transcriptional regulator [Candidatus Thermoplasmatota archaeon]
MRKPWLLLIAAFALAAPPAQAAEGAGQLQASATAGLWGTVTAGPLDGGVLGVADDGASLVARAPALTVTVITYRNGAEDSRETFPFNDAVITLAPGARAFLTSPDPDAGQAWTFRLADARTLPDDPAAASMVPAAVLSSGALPTFDSPDLRGAAPAGPGPTGPAMVALHPMLPSVVEGALALRLLPDSTLRVASSDGARDFATETHQETRTEGAVDVPVVGPTGGQQVTDTIYNLTLLDAASAVVELPANEPGREDRATLLARDPTVHVAGAAMLRDAVGQIVVGSQSHRAQRQPVVVAGDFDLGIVGGSGPLDSAWSARAPLLAPPGEGPRSDFAIAGDLTSVRIGGQATVDYAPMAVAAGAGAVGLAGLLLLVPAAKFGATKLLVAPLYTRLKKPEVLEQKRREALLDAIRADPGVNATELGQKLSMGWGNLVYHLGVLERERLVSSTREGRHRRFFPVGLVDHRFQEPLALLRNPSAARVMEVIRAQPGLPQKLLSRQTGLSPSTINWHVERLSDAGLVWRRQEGREVQYFPSDLLLELAPPDRAMAG